MEEPKIGLALGSGGARGLAHIGVIRALEEAEIPISMIAGSSIGALVGSFYAAGHRPEAMEKISNVFRKKYFLDLSVPKMGFVTGQRIKNFIRIFTYDKNIEDLDIPIGIVACDLQTGEKVVFRNGPVADAVRASISIPGIFVPERIDGRLYVDGGVSERIPVATLKEMGADIIIGVDVAGFRTDATISNVYDVILQTFDIMQMKLWEQRKVDADCMIYPPVGAYGTYSFEFSKELIELGERAAVEKIREIRQLIQRWKESAS